MADGLEETLAERELQRAQQQQATAQRIAQGLLRYSPLTDGERQQMQAVAEGQDALITARVLEAEAEVAKARARDLKAGGES